MSPMVNTKSRPKAQEFSEPESFGRFMEALRDLQFYAEYSASGEPDTARLDQNLDEARESLEKCHRDFPSDLLPRFYLAITLTMQNQRLYAQELASVDPQADPKRLLEERPWPLLDRAADLFDGVMKCDDPGLSTAAKFNLAHVYAKRAQRGDLERALQLLHPLPTLPSPPKTPSFWSSPWERMPRRGGSLEAAADRNFHEAVALFFQARTLCSAIKARIALESKKESEFKTASNNLVQTRNEIENSESLTPEQKHDLLADSWTKSGFLAYSHAVDVASAREPDLQEAEKNLNRALQYKPYWIPAQTYLAMVNTAQGRPKDALTALKSVLGTAATEMRVPVNVPNVDDIVSYILAMPLGTPAATISGLVLRGFGPLDHPTLQTLVRALNHAKLKMELIDEITKGLEPLQR
jgi:hypothetical protein